MQLMQLFVRQDRAMIAAPVSLLKKPEASQQQIS
jgi:hypothetical protein